MNLKIQQKNALVCGSTQGIGKSTAILLAEEGVNVTLISRNEEKLKAVLAELPNKHQNHNYLVADFSNPTKLKQVLEASELQFHILVNNTGGPAGGPIFNAKIEEFENNIPFIPGFKDLINRLSKRSVSQSALRH